ncbi:MAG: plasmid mobilization relaxosome protein MobC [Sphingobacteriaceae bacterium]|nr:plasmid mobilization relaxosome protein MobC [Sphingobacteriaceae bacterium]
MENKQENRTRRITLRLTVAEYAKIEKNWRNTLTQKLSDHLRNLIFRKPIVTTCRNRSIDDLVIELGLLRQELNRIGVNFNQSVKKLHTLQETPQFMRWLTTHEIEKRTLANKMDEIKNHMQKIVEIVFEQR